jgi:septation ring formation regulator EzrA
MATATRKVQCFTCDKAKITYSCKGCSQDFCYDHLTEHRQTFGKQLDEIENDRDEFRHTLIHLKEEELEKRPLIRQINRWEYYSIEKIKKTAEDCRQTVIEHTNKCLSEIEIKLSELTEELRQVRRENEFNEIDLNEFKIKLTKLAEELVIPPNISTEHDCTSFINKISVISSSGKCDQHILVDQKLN